MKTKAILVTGATGYVGGRLVPMLLNAGYRVLAMARSRAKLESRSWARHPRLEIVEGDALRMEDVMSAAAGCNAAYYLVHSMNPGQRDFEDADRRAADIMARASAACGLDRIVYLGGLGEEDPSLSKHLRSRHEVAAILGSGSVPVTVLRAAMIIGSGSASFEILRYLVDRLPVMVTPRWVRTPSQPIAVSNVLNYLKACLESDETKGRSFDIGGPEVLTYHDIMRIYAEEAGLPKRWIVPLPVLTPRLSSYWIHLVTPVHASLARPLAAGLKNPVVCKEFAIQALVPQDLMTCREAIRAALDSQTNGRVETSWTDAGALVPEKAQGGDPAYAGGSLLSAGYWVRGETLPEAIWKPIQEIGGRRGWYHGNALWRMRGWMDRLLGGVGLRRGRRHPTELLTGDALDFWRVIDVEPPKRLLLRAEMKVPGEALLEFRISRTEEGDCELVQISRFRPRGLFGLLYWYALYPIHAWVFKGMLKALVREAGMKRMLGPVPQSRVQEAVNPLLPRCRRAGPSATAREWR